MRIFNYRWLTIMAGVGIALLAGELFPNLARASCGDYVTVGSETQRHNSVSPSRPCSRPDQSCPRNSTPAKGPCQGPECSRGEAPAPAPPTTTPQTNQDHAFLGVAPLTVVTPTLFIQAQGDVVVPVHLSSPIFRPPRSI